MAEFEVEIRKDDEGFVPDVYDPAKVPRHIPKLVLIDRLQAVGLFEVARTTLLDDPLKYERWQASRSVDPQDPDVRDWLWQWAAMSMHCRCSSEKYESVSRASDRKGIRYRHSRSPPSS